MLEFEFINKILLPLTKKNSSSQTQKNPSQNLEDDVALLNFDKDFDLIISKDIFIEDVHFLKSDGAEKIASKLLLTNLSDIASSGGEPLYYMMGFTKNSTLNDDFYQEFGKALKVLQQKYKLTLIGGDTSNSDKLFYSITIFGKVKKNKILSRKNAKNDDLIFVSNSIGDAFLGLDLKLKNLKKLENYHQKLLDKHFYPQPRIELAQELINKNLSKCATDISDGLIADLSNICKASKLNAEIYLSQIPLSKEAKIYLKNNPKINVLELLSGGDDYELIFSINPKNLNKIEAISKRLNLKLTCIGRFFKESDYQTNKNSSVFLFPDEQNKTSKTLIKILKQGYEHQ
jgi:thiamine-monophosphate kinase